jgi:hypothetical protein
MPHLNWWGMILGVDRDDRKGQGDGRRLRHQVAPSRESSEGLLSGTLLETLHRIIELPDAAGGHACECGHPEMRHLPDGVYWCPACGSEVLPPG